MCCCDMSGEEVERCMAISLITSFLPFHNVQRTDVFLTHCWQATLGGFLAVILVYIT